MGIRSFFDPGNTPNSFARGPVLVVTPDWWKPDGTGKLVICAPGHLAPELDYNVNQPAGNHIRHLVLTGYAVVAFKFSQWAQPIVPTEADDLVAWCGAHSSIGCDITRYGLVGWSMGGLDTLRISRERPDRVKCWWGWNPLTDGQWAMSTTGYIPPYSVAGTDPAKQASFKQEIADIYGVPVGSPPPAGIDALALAAEHRGRPHHLVQVLDDVTIPPASAVTFKDAVADPLCTLTQPDSGGHLNPFSGTSTKDFLQFFQAYL